jgi:hypothetical protein
MKNEHKGEYLAPETEVVKMETEKVVLQLTSLHIPAFNPLNPSEPSSIEDSIEGEMVGW